MAQQAAEFTCLNMSGKERPSFQKYPLTSILHASTHANSDLESKVRLRECERCVFFLEMRSQRAGFTLTNTSLFLFCFEKVSVTQAHRELTLKYRLPSSLLQSFCLRLLSAGITGMHSYAKLNNVLA